MPLIADDAMPAAAMIIFLFSFRFACFYLHYY